MKYIIRWNAGYGEDFDEVECDDAEEASELAYQNCKDGFNSNADFEVIGESTEELLEEYGL